MNTFVSFMLVIGSVSLAVSVIILVIRAVLGKDAPYDVLGQIMNTAFITSIVCFSSLLLSALFLFGLDLLNH